MLNSFSKSEVLGIPLSTPNNEPHFLLTLLHKVSFFILMLARMSRFRLDPVIISHFTTRLETDSLAAEVKLPTPCTTQPPPQRFLTRMFSLVFQGCSLEVHSLVLIKLAITLKLKVHVNVVAKHRGQNKFRSRVSFSAIEFPLSCQGLREGHLSCREILTLLIERA
ncbi:hypothetical protein BDZ45DRAFT_378222 [Acephala macrosclerotiorum]|nr:hypothetical protein BDZ45DRAFT_378222 [Acephala macrosclerotiorum]